MSELVVLTFEQENEAGEVLKALRGVQHSGGLSLSDTAVIVKGQDGKVHVDNELSSATEVGMVAGGMIGLFLTFMFPVAGLVMGAAAGAGVGALMDAGVDRKFVKELSEELQPGNSALFLIIREANPEMALNALKPYKGKVYQTTLSTETEESLKRVLKDPSKGETEWHVPKA